MTVRQGKTVGRGFAFFVLVSGIMWLLFGFALAYDNFSVGRDYETDAFFLFLIIFMLSVGFGFAAYGTRKLMELRIAR